MYKIKLLLAKSAMRPSEARELGYIKSQFIPELNKTIVYNNGKYKVLSCYYEVDENNELIIVLILHKINN